LVEEAVQIGLEAASSLVEALVVAVPTTLRQKLPAMKQKPINERLS